MEFDFVLGENTSENFRQKWSSITKHIIEAARTMKNKRALKLLNSKTFKEMKEGSGKSKSIVVLMFDCNSHLKVL